MTAGEEWVLEGRGGAGSKTPRSVVGALAAIAWAGANDSRSADGSDYPNLVALRRLPVRVALLRLPGFQASAFLPHAVSLF
jgi:hypothetical protein